MAVAIPYVNKSFFSIRDLAAHLERVDDAYDHRVHRRIGGLFGITGRGPIGDQDQISRPRADRVYSDEWLASHFPSRVGLANDEQLASTDGFIFDR